MMNRKLDTYPLPQSVCSKLSSNGFISQDDLHGIKPSQLAKETGLTGSEAVAVLDTVFPKKTDLTNSSLGTSALEFFIEERQKPPIPTFCQDMDDLLGGGIPLRKLTELCGAPGVGKTQLCLQLCTTVQIPDTCGGLDGEAVFIDTEGSFVVDRLIQIADATVDACQKIMQASDPSCLDRSFTTKKILEGVYYFRCKDFAELVACVNTIDEFIKKHPKISLLVIDSVSFHFRYGFQESYASRSKLLFGLSQTLIKVADEFKLAVVLTNQMTHKVGSDNQSSLVPALGESWGHACTIRLILKLTEAKREAFLFKSPWKQEDTAFYRITTSGIRDHFEFPLAGTSSQPGQT